MYQAEQREIAGRFTFVPMDDVFFGSGIISELGAVLESYGVKNAALITGNSLGANTEMMDRIHNAAGGRIGSVFQESVMHVHSESVLRATEHCRANNADAVVTFGGGTPNDTGKAVVMALAEGIAAPGDFERMKVKFSYPEITDVPAITGATVPMFAISTTLSAGEFTYFTGITDEVRQVKELYLDKKMSAKAVFLDPDLTLATPEWLWLSTGLRSVDHCIESICSNSSHPVTDATAAHALGFLNTNLRRCKEDPSDLGARTYAHLAAWMSIAGLANVQLGLCHGIGHQLGARCNVPHGQTSAVMMHSVMTWNKDHVGSKQRWIAEIMGVDTRGMTESEAGEAGRDAIRQLVIDLGQPYRLQDVGVSKEDFAAIAADAMNDLVVSTNPRPVTSADEVVEVLEMAY